MGQLDPDYVKDCERRACGGDANALYELGKAYSTGHGVPIDLIEAHKWFNLAVARGYKEAAHWREEIADELSAAEITRAQREAREWFKTH